MCGAPGEPQPCKLGRLMHPSSSGGSCTTHPALGSEVRASIRLGKRQWYYINPTRFALWILQLMGSISFLRHWFHSVTAPGCFKIGPYSILAPAPHLVKTLSPKARFNGVLWNHLSILILGICTVTSRSDHSCRTLNCGSNGDCEHWLAWIPECNGD